MNNQVINYIIEQLKEIRNGKLWMGDTFERKISSISDEDAFVRPLPDLHSIAELIAHLTAWKKDALLKLKQGKGELKDGDEENWPGIESLKKTGWSNLLKDFDQSHQNIIDFLRSKNDSFLLEKYYDQDFKGDFRYSFVIDGIVHHDLYHLGQMGLVVKLIKSKS